MRLRCVLIARCLVCRGCPHNKFSFKIGTTVSDELKIEKRHQGPWSTILQVQFVPAKRSYGSEDITSDEYSARVWTRDLVTFQKFQINSRIKINVDHWEKSTVPELDTVLSTSEEK